MTLLSVYISFHDVALVIFEALMTDPEAPLENRVNGIFGRFIFFCFRCAGANFYNVRNFQVFR